MASEQAIHHARRALRGAGVASPWKTDPDLADALNTWLRLLADLPDAALLAAVDAHLRRSEWWPRPAQLLELAPRAQPERLAEGSSWPGQLLLHVDPRRRIALLDQATAEVRRQPACGRPIDSRCPAGCDPCSTAIMQRADQLVASVLEEQETAA